MNHSNLPIFSQSLSFFRSLIAETLTKHRDFEGLDHGYVLLLNSVEVIRTFMRKTKTLVEELPSCTGNTYNKSSTTVNRMVQIQTSVKQHNNVYVG